MVRRGNRSLLLPVSPDRFCSEASGPASANEGDTVTYNITVTNAGPSSASGVVLTDTLPSNLSFKSASTGQGTFSVSNGVVTFSVGTVASGGTVTASVTAVAIEDGSTSERNGFPLNVRR